MYSLTIHFGSNAICWAFLFKEEEKAGAIYSAYMDFKISENVEGVLIGNDDFGQTFSIPMHQINGILIEDLDLVEAARIQRSLAEERCKVKLLAAAKSDPVIGAAIRQQQANTGVLTPFRQ